MTMAFGRREKAGKIDLLGRAQEQQEMVRRYEEKHGSQTHDRKRTLGDRETVEAVPVDGGASASYDHEAVGASGRKKKADAFSEQMELDLVSAIQQEELPLDDVTRAKIEGDVMERVRRKMRDQYGDQITQAHDDPEFAKEIRESIDLALQSESNVRTVRQRENLTGRIYNLIMGLGPLEEIFADETISEIMVSRYDKVFIERDGKMVLSDVKFSSEEELRMICDQIVSRVGRAVNDAHPLADARLADGSRVNIALPPVSVDGTTLTIRRFPKKKMKPEDYLAFCADSERVWNNWEEGETWYLDFNTQEKFQMIPEYEEYEILAYNGDYFCLSLENDIGSYYLAVVDKTGKTVYSPVQYNHNSRFKPCFWGDHLIYHIDGELCFVSMADWTTEKRAAIQINSEYDTNERMCLTDIASPDVKYNIDFDTNSYYLPDGTAAAVNMEPDPALASPGVFENKLLVFHFYDQTYSYLNNDLTEFNVKY